MFFFFFFDEELSENAVVQEALRAVCFERLLTEGYCDMNLVFDKPKQKKDDLAFRLHKIKSPLEALFIQTYPKNMEEIKKNLLPILEKPVWKEKSINKFEMFIIVYYIYKAFPKYIDKIEMTKELFASWQDGLTSDKYYIQYKNVELQLSEGILYDESRIELNIIRNIAGYMNLLDKCEEHDNKIFFRGHADINYDLVPSVFRTTSWRDNEKKMYQELMINCADEFSEMKNHLEILAEMQHYGLPTRLLDITQNPLVALFFACENEIPYAGEVVLLSVKQDEIKYPQSDTVAMLASLPLFDFKSQSSFLKKSLEATVSKEDFNEYAIKLVQEVRTERAGFRAAIDKEDIKRNIIVIPSRNNKRIIKQEGAFVICGLLEEIYLNSEMPNSIAELRAKNKEDKKMICVVIHKDKILKQLNSLSINKAKIYPEIDDVADYIKNHINEI